MTKELRELLQVVTEGNNDLWEETIDASKKILEGGYEGHKEDVEALEGIKTGFELEKVLSQGKWYWQEKPPEKEDEMNNKWELVLYSTYDGSREGLGDIKLRIFIEKTPLDVSDDIEKIKKLDLCHMTHSYYGWEELMDTLKKIHTTNKIFFFEDGQFKEFEEGFDEGDLEYEAGITTF